MTRWLGWLAALGLLAGLAMGFGVAPKDAVQGNVQRIMYVHVPSILTAYLAFALVLAGMPPASQAETYGEFAEGLLRSLPDGARFRPDLEAVIAGLANRYRAGEGKAPLESSSLFRNAARAHAAAASATGCDTP